MSDRGSRRERGKHVVALLSYSGGSAADRAARPEWYFRQLERWCSRMVVRAAEAMEKE